MKKILIVLVILILATLVVIKINNKNKAENARSGLAKTCTELLSAATFPDAKTAEEFMTKCLKGETGQTPITKAPIENKNNTTQPLDKFTGKLEKVDTGCFADGECFVVIDGKHVTLVIGRKQEVAGQIIGGDNSIGGLESFIGKDFEVYAKKIDATNYTLYGSANYYVKLK